MWNNVLFVVAISRELAAAGQQAPSRSLDGKSLSAEDACKDAHRLKQQDLHKEDQQVILLNGDFSLSLNGLREISYECWFQVISSDHLVATPEQVFNAALSWAAAECERRSMEPSPANMRAVLDRSLYEIRFAEMNHSFLLKSVFPSKVLTHVEQMVVHDLVGCERSIFPVQDRRDPLMDVFLYKSHRQPEIYLCPPYDGADGETWESTEFNTDDRTFESSEDVWMYGIYTFGTFEKGRQPREYIIWIRTTGGETLMWESLLATNTSRNPYSDTISELYFDSPIRLQKHVTHNIDITLMSKEVPEFCGEGLNYEANIGRFEFKLMFQAKSQGCFQVAGYILGKSKSSGFGCN
ncbi:BTB/POZ domain-containing protein 6-B-like [Haliotis rubra]|uniref:BTB/POZ domain-containing protein 6-B-like n=1 Tax=Haliotis rubra TaxID=36100 RepID=UPI001EE5240B|nr:BTB/POZ domain-containing protein 6-B-like [Haliotis rubra]